MTDIKFSHQDQIQFKDWLELNLNSISWEGRYLDDFNKVWDTIFEANLTFSEQFRTLEQLEGSLDQGPIISWFRWLKLKFVCFTFIYKDLSLKEISDNSDLSVSSVALTIRNFLIERYPHREEQLNMRLQIGNVLSENLHLKFSQLEEEFAIHCEINGTMNDEVLKDLEVTLYSDWTKLRELLIDEKIGFKNVESILKDKKFVGRQIKFLQELVGLFVIGGLLIFTIKVGNKAYEEYLVKKISLFSPNFFWLDKSLSFKGTGFVGKKGLDIQLDEIEALEKLESKKTFEDIEVTTRYEVESDVVLTSVDTLPKDFEVAGLEQSNYEEVRKGGFRNSRYGRRKAYRVMMTSVNPEIIKQNLLKELDKFGVKQTDNVKPGTKIPGGIYFNLYVPRKRLKEFLSKVTSFEDKSTILESKTVFGGPPNTNKVFIWIKSI